LKETEVVMSRHKNYPVLVIGLVLASAAHADAPGDDKQTSKDIRTDLYGDPLPTGARVRLGTARFRGSEFGFSCAALSPDGKLLAVASHRGPVVIWDVAAGRELRRILGDAPLGLGFHSTGLTFSPNSNTLAVADMIGGIQLWEVASGKSLRQFMHSPGPHGSVTFSGDGKTLAVGADFGSDSGSSVWDVFTGKLRVQVKPEGMRHGGVALSPDGKSLATWGENQFVQLWDVDTGKKNRRLELENGRAVAAVFSPNGRTLATADGSEISLWEITTGKQVLSVAGRNGIGASLAYSPKGKTLAAATHDGALQIWQVGSGKRISTSAGPQCRISSLVFVDENRVLACGIAGQSIRLWEAPSGKLLTPKGGHQERVTAVRFSADGKSLVSIGADGTICQWEAASSKKTSQIDFVKRDDPFGIPFSHFPQALAPNLKYFVAQDGQGKISLMETATGQAITEISGSTGREHKVVFSPDSSILAVADGERFSSESAAVFLWDVGKRKKLHDLRRFPGDLAGIAFSPDGRTLATGNFEWRSSTREKSATQVHLWDVATGEERSQFKCPGGLIELAFSPDGKLLAGTGESGIYLCDAVAGKPVRLLATAKGWMTWISGPPVFSPDGQTLAYGLTENQGQRISVRLLEIATGKLLHEFTGHRAGISCLAFSRDGKSLASGSSDSTTLVWDLTGRFEEEAARPAIRPRFDEDSLWSQLASTDLEVAQQAMKTLIGTPQETVSLMGKHLRPMPAKTSPSKEIAQLLRDLDNDDLKVREQATRRLEELGSAAQLALREGLEDNPSPEVRRRIEGLLTKLEEPSSFRERLRPLRAVKVLEQIGTPEAKKVLQTLTHGRPEAALTKEAKAALERLAK
jgi:WD40 repeat protein